MKPQPPQPALPPLAFALLAGLAVAAAAAPGSVPSAAPDTSAPASAVQRAELEATAIIGQRELPKVIYIVPWKQPQPATPSARPVRSVLDEVLAPIDRGVLQRQIAFHAQAQAQNPAQTKPQAHPPTHPETTAPAAPRTPSR